MGDVIKGPDPTGRLTELEQKLTEARDRDRAAWRRQVEAGDLGLAERHRHYADGLDMAIAILMDVRGDRDADEPPAPSALEVG